MPHGNVQCLSKANRVSSESHQACLNGRVAFEVDKVKAMPSSLEHCRAAAKLHGEAIMFNVQCSMFNLKKSL